MAKSIRLHGAVQVQVLISEEGRVLSTGVVSGHPILRAAAEEAARQWLFKPTMLNEVPVKVQGILTFNFTLN
jgi:protein TonB